MSYTRELLKGSTDSLLLCVISREPMYGYRIIKELEQKSQGYFCFGEGTLYPALHRLERSGLIKGTWERLPGGQERRYYEITGQGRRILAEKLEEWRGFSTAVNMIVQPAG